MNKFDASLTKKAALVFIFVLALFLRVYKLGSCPVGFLWDEAALGYNGYSILKTGRDEYGKFLPIIFKSFGDYKPGLYVYLTVPSIAIFGLNEFSTRLPAAIFGSLTVLLIYFFIKEAFFLTKEKDRKFSETIALTTAILLAISPWHLNFSRGAWEVTIMIFLLVLGFYLILKFLNTKKPAFFVFSIVVLILSLFAYQASKLLMPILTLAFFYFFRKYFKETSSKIRKSFVVLVLLASFLFNLFSSLEERGGRLKVMSIFSYPRSAEETQDLTLQDKNNKFD
ncbi:MAG: glycosyltransferase family 39 protein, partial [Patescibacteria group bacterium]|nr:glycosyltransferase family 39 protein [Patescibacteria group bacterium]